MCPNIWRSSLKRVLQMIVGEWKCCKRAEARKSEKKQWRHVECPREEKKTRYGIYLLFSGCIAWMEVAPCLWDMPKSEEDSWTGAAVWLLLLRASDALELIFSGTSSCFEILAPCNACMLLWRFLCVWFEQRTSGGGPGWSRLNSDSEVAIITPVESSGLIGIAICTCIRW